MVASDDPFEAALRTEALDPDAARRELAGPKYRNLAALEISSGRAEGWVATLEGSAYLVDQVAFLGGFERTAQDLEDHLLPTLIQRGDWPRFLRFAALALQLRRVATELADEDLVIALAESGRFLIARDAVARIADPWAAARARSALARVAPSTHGEDFRTQIAAVITQLKDGEPDTQGRAFAGLCAVARDHGRLPGMDWEGWSARLAPSSTAAIAVRGAVAAAWLDLGDPRHAELWAALAAVADPASLLTIAPRRLAECVEEGCAGQVLAQLEELFPSASAEQASAVLRFCAALAARFPARAQELAQARGSLLVHASIAELDAAFPWLVRLPSAVLRAWGEVSPTPAQRAFWWAAVLRATGEPEWIPLARDAVHAVVDPDERLRAATRYLAARPPDAAARAEFLALAHHLDGLFFAAPTAELARFLDLAAEHSPVDLATFLDGFAWARATDGARWLELTATLQREEVLVLIVANAERYAAAAGGTEAEGFALRGRLRAAATRRRCALRGDLLALSEAREMLLEVEEESLRADLVEDLAAAGQAELALEVAAGMTTPRLRLLSRLRAEAGSSAPTLGAVELYRALAHPGRLEDEAACLGALLETPLDPFALADAWLDGIAHRATASHGLLLLAEHALAYQERTLPPRRQDRKMIFELLRARLGYDTDAELVAATPEVVHLAARLVPRFSDLERAEARRRLAQLDGLSAATRDAALARLEAPVPADEPAGSDDAAWLEQLALEVVQGSLDLAAPVHHPRLFGLWRLEPAVSCPRLARAVVDTFRQGDPERGEQALRWFLHAWVRPRLGDARPEAEADLSVAMAALRAAQTLGASAAGEGHGRPG